MNQQQNTLYEINREAFIVLTKELGLSKTIRFLNQFNTGKGNYTKLKDGIYKEKTVQDIVNDINKPIS